MSFGSRSNLVKLWQLDVNLDCCCEKSSRWHHCLSCTILSAILEFVIAFGQNSTAHVHCHYAQFSQKNKVSELQPIIVFHCRHFVRYLGICNRICANLPQLMFGVITHNSMKKLSHHFNKWLSYSQIWCFTAAILSAILEFVIRFVSDSYRLCSVSFYAI